MSLCLAIVEARIRSDFSVSPDKLPDQFISLASTSFASAVGCMLGECCSFAIISDANATTVVEPGWTARRATGGALLLERTHDR